MTDELLEHVRKRPGLYVGSTGFWGFINYVVCAYRLLIHWGATRIELTLGTVLTLSSDATLPSDLDTKNPFESISKNYNHVDAFILNALSKRLDIHDADGFAYAYELGKRVPSSSEHMTSSGATIQFIPDDGIFSVTDIQPAVVCSYLHRMSYLYPRIQFSIVADDYKWVYSHPCGIAKMFDGVSAPYQLLHEPIHVSGKDGDFELELVFAFHSWSEKMTWTFANYGRAADGGTHDVGLRSALDDFADKVIANDDVYDRPGYLAILSFKYPNVQFEGCIKGEIGNVELETKTHNLVGKLLSLVDVAGLTHLKDMSRFQFADFW